LNRAFVSSFRFKTCITIPTTYLVCQGAGFNSFQEILGVKNSQTTKQKRSKARISTQRIENLGVKDCDVRKKKPVKTGFLNLKCQWRDLNPRPKAYESSALPLSYTGVVSRG
jgi:hypothetical protein